MDILILLCNTVILFQLSSTGFCSEIPTTFPAFQRNVCLLDAIHIHDELFQKICPYSHIKDDKRNCSISCILEFENDNSYYNKNHGIDYMLFNQRNDLSIFQVFWDVSNCIMKTVTIRCDFQYLKENRIGLNFETSQEEGTLEGPLVGLINAVIGCSLGVMLILFGGWVIKTLRDKCRKRHFLPENLDLYPTSQSSNDPAVYSEIEELGMLVKATQVPSPKDNTPLSERSIITEMGSIDKSTTLSQEIGSDQLRTTNHLSHGSRHSQSSGSIVKEDVQQRGSCDSKKYFQLEQQNLA